MVTRNGTFSTPMTDIKHRNLRYLTTDLGKHGNIEIVVYSKGSIFAKNQILKNSPDPLARSIALQELLELMNVVMVLVPHSTELGVGAVATQTANATIASALATVGTFVATS